MTDRSASLYDANAESSQQGTRANSISSRASSGYERLTFWNETPTPLTTPPGSDPSALRRPSSTGSKLLLNPAVSVDFTNGNRLFKLRYTAIDIVKDAAGSVRCIELSGTSGQAGVLVHVFNNAKIPIPHLEQPYTVGQSAPRISFLEEQSIQVANTVVATRPSYRFDSGNDCKSFQEAILGQSLLFMSGVAEINSKGRGEECVSQNLRLLQSPSGLRNMMFFTNARKTKRYVSVPLTSIASLEPNRRKPRAVAVKLQPDNDMLAQFKSLQITFLEEEDTRRFCRIVST